MGVTTSEFQRRQLSPKPIQLVKSYGESTTRSAGSTASGWSNAWTQSEVTLSKRGPIGIYKRGSRSGNGSAPRTRSRYTLLYFSCSADVDRRRDVPDRRDVRDVLAFLSLPRL